ncbi:hypothetical protein V6N12_056551 [Hibiscus sabdariffa]|uniref:Uncharacterized protein n=1 Tax=Hibiscus sabdariffa TaxID=183260 RepID=A0ABR2CTB2_9ROSI
MEGDLSEKLKREVEQLLVATAIETNSATLFAIKTVVVLIQENHSLDHMLGWFKILNPEIDGITGSKFNPISTFDSSSTQVIFKDTIAYFDHDPDHSF